MGHRQDILLDLIRTQERAVAAQMAVTMANGQDPGPLRQYANELRAIEEHIQNWGNEPCL